MVFALATDDGNLMVFASAAQAEAYCEGVDVEDGVWSFFAENGAPLSARFDRPNERGRFAVVSATYTLEPAAGPWLHDRLAEVRGVEGGGFGSIAEVKSHLAQRKE